MRLSGRRRDTRVETCPTRCCVLPAGPRTRRDGSSAASAARRCRSHARRADHELAGNEVLRRVRDGARCRRSRSADSSLSPAAERRLVSVLFADLVGYTALSEGRDFEDVRDPDALLRHGPHRHRALRRHGREVHRRRGHGGLGRTRRTRGRRRACRPGSARARRRRRDARERPTFGSAPECSPARRRSQSEPRAREWSRATSSTPRRASRPPRPPAPSSSATRRTGRPRPRSRIRLQASASSRGRPSPCSSGRPCA